MRHIACCMLLNTKDFQLVFWTWPLENSEMKLKFLPFSFNHLVQAKIPADGQKSEKYRGRCYWQKPLIYVETTFYCIFLALKSLIMSLLSFLLALLWGNYMFWRIICQILGWKTTWKPFGKVCHLYATALLCCNRLLFSMPLFLIKINASKWKFH